jgi:hypothetical protein
MFSKTHLFAVLCLAASASRVLADEGEVDVRGFEYLDVVETTDGSIWKGVLVEQTPNVQYKIATADGSLHVIKAADIAKLTKQRNKDWRGSSSSTSTSTTGNGLATHYDGGSTGLPAAFAKSGLRIDPSFVTVFGAGDVSTMDASFSPSVTVGYEAMFGNFGLSGGGMARYTYWRLPALEDPADAFWTLETHAYGRAALHISRVAMFGGVSLGLDTNMVHVGMLNMSKTTTGFGMNLQAGAEVAASDTVALKVGFDFHPGTDTILDGANKSVSYYALVAGASIRL